MKLSEISRRIFLLCYRYNSNKPLVEWVIESKAVPQLRDRLVLQIKNILPLVIYESNREKADQKSIITISYIHVWYDLSYCVTQTKQIRKSLTFA